MIVSDRRSEFQFDDESSDLRMPFATLVPTFKCILCRMNSLRKNLRFGFAQWEIGILSSDNKVAKCHLLVRKIAKYFFIGPSKHDQLFICTTEECFILPARWWDLQPLKRVRQFAADVCDNGVELRH